MRSSNFCLPRVFLSFFITVCLAVDCVPRSLPAGRPVRYLASPGVTSLPGDPFTGLETSSDSDVQVTDQQVKLFLQGILISLRVYIRAVNDLLIEEIVPQNRPHDDRLTDDFTYPCGVFRQLAKDFGGKTVPEFVPDDVYRKVARSWYFLQAAEAAGKIPPEKYDTLKIIETNIWKILDTLKDMISGPSPYPLKNFYQLDALLAVSRLVVALPDGPLKIQLDRLGNEIYRLFDASSYRPEIEDREQYYSSLFDGLMRDYKDFIDAFLMQRHSLPDELDMEQHLGSIKEKLNALGNDISSGSTRDLILAGIKAPREINEIIFHVSNMAWMTAHQWKKICLLINAEAEVDLLEEKEAFLKAYQLADKLLQKAIGVSGTLRFEIAPEMLQNFQPGPLRDYYLQRVVKDTNAMVHLLDQFSAALNGFLVEDDIQILWSDTDESELSHHRLDGITDDIDSVRSMLEAFGIIFSAESRKDGSSIRRYDQSTHFTKKPDYIGHDPEPRSSEENLLELAQRYIFHSYVQSMPLRWEFKDEDFSAMIGIVNTIENIKRSDQPTWEVRGKVHMMITTIDSLIGKDGSTTGGLIGDMLNDWFRTISDEVEHPILFDTNLLRDARLFLEQYIHQNEPPRSIPITQEHRNLISST